MNDKKTLMYFPCDFPLKIIGNNSAKFFEDITNIVRKHFPKDSEVTIESKPSETNKYLAITATIRVYNQHTLDELYREITQHPDIKMVL